VRYDADNSGMIDESEWLVLISDLIDGTFSPTAGAGSPTKASPGGGSYQPNYGAGDTSTEAQLIAEVQSLRAANGALEARVGILEAQMRQLLGGGPVVGASGYSSNASPSSSRAHTPTEFERPVTNSRPRTPTEFSSRPASASGLPKKEVRRSCPYCGHSWLDKYGKDECPKCLNPLSAAGAVPRAPGEATSNKLSAASAMESESGKCPKGGAHTFRFGKCSKCGKGEGAELADRNAVAPSECPSGGKHVFKFTKCIKCGGIEGKC